MRRMLGKIMYGRLPDNRLKVLRGMPSSFNDMFLKRYGNYSEAVEHQVGRYIGMQLVAEEVCKRAGREEIKVVEFGTYKGVGTFLLSNAFESKSKNADVSFLCIDGFVGLPETSTIWKKGKFNDASYEDTNSFLTDHVVHRCELVEDFFDGEKARIALEQVKQEYVVVHLDGDLGSSTRDACHAIELLLTRCKCVALLLDDWGNHPSEVPDAFWEWWCGRLGKDIRALRKINETRNTRYYLWEGA